MRKLRYIALTRLYNSVLPLPQRTLIRWSVLTILIIECLCAPFAVADYKRINKADPDDPMAVAIYRLDNGLMVYLTENHETPHFYAEIAVRVGSKYDPPDATGLAHYLEHLLFKGTRKVGTLDYAKEKPHLDRITELYEEHFHESDPAKRKEIYAAIDAESQKAARYAIPNEIDKAYKIMGGSEVNAHTGFEEIVCKVQLPSNRLRQWAAIESERFTNPVFRLFHTELETVYEEKNRFLDNKMRIILEAVLYKLFKRHPYGQQSLIGSVEHLKKPSLRKLYSFYETYYVPNNMAIFISGAIDSQETIHIIDEYFSAWKSKRLPRRTRWKEKPLTKVERVHINYLGEEYVLLAFRTPRFKHPDFERLLLFNAILGNSQVGLINLNLVLPQKIRSAGSYIWMMNDYGMQFLWGVPKEGQTLKEVEDLLLGEIERIKNGEFEQETLNDIITNIKIEEKKGLESNISRATEIRDSFLSFVSWKYWLGFLKRLERVRKKDIIRMAKKYFKNNYVAGYRHDKQHDIPSIKKPDITPTIFDSKRQSAFMKHVLAMPINVIEPEYIESDTDYQMLHDSDGVTYYYTENPLNDLFALAISIDVGTHFNNTIGLALGFLNRSGTLSLSPQQLKRKWYSLGCRFAPLTGDDETVFAIFGLDENFEESIALLAEILHTPASDEATLSEFKKIVRINRRDMKKDPKILVAALRNFNLYDQESLYLNMLPVKTLEKKSVNDLYAIIKDLLSYKRTISYVGSLSFDEVRKITRKYIGGRKKLRDPPVYIKPRVRLHESTEIYFFNKELAQTRIVIEFAGQEYSEKDTPSAQLFNYYFGRGMSGVATQELRESRALAYIVEARYVLGSRRNQQNRMKFVIETQSDKTVEALHAALELIDDGALTPERFSDTQESVINRYRIAKVGFRDVIGVVRKWGRLGLSPDPRRERFRKIKTMQIDTLRGFHQKEIANHPKLISIVGDKNKIDMEALQKIGRITYIDLDDIFVD